MTTTIYNYDSQTGEFTYAAPADESPLEPGKILLPASATTTEPPNTAPREVAVFSDGLWHIKADWRGASLFSTTDGRSVTIDEIGLSPADVDATDQAMPSPSHTWIGGAWKLDPLKQAAQLAELHAQTLGRVREERQPIISVLDGLQASALAKGDSVAALALETVKQGLRDITKTDLSAYTTADEMRTAIMTAYAKLVAANPTVATAFKGVIS